MSILTNFNNLIDSHDSFIFDIWGVIYDGVNPYPNTVYTLNALLENKEKEVFFLSNTPRPHDITYKNLANMGINLRLDQVLTSGDIARSYIRNLGESNKIYHLGKEGNQDILRDIKNDLVDDLEYADLLLLTLFLDKGDDLDQYDSLLMSAAKMGLNILCPNPDKEVIHGQSQRYCAGYFAQKIENFGGTVKYIGKPHSDVYHHIFKKLKNQNLDRILMVGDTIETDVLGAQNVNIKSALTLTGNGKKFISDKYDSESEGLIRQACNELKISMPSAVIEGVF